MPKLIIGPINKSLRTDRLPFNIDNDSFPTIINAYQWRGRVKRKRGTNPLGRQNRFLGTTDGAGNLTITIAPQPISTATIMVTIGTDVFVDPGTTANPGVQTLLTNSVAGVATLNRVSGVLTITGSIPATSVIYNPGQPVLGLRDLSITSTQYPGNLAFDQNYAYNITSTSGFKIYDVSFYKNPIANGTFLPGYTPKATPTPTYWNSANYQQMWSVNFQGALWVTNGIKFANNVADLSTIGMQFENITNISNIVPGPPATAKLTIPLHGLIQGDFVFINEVGGVTGINFQTGYVITVNDPNNVTVKFPFATLGGVYTVGGIAQYLTSNIPSPQLDCLRWYDGDPTNGNATSPTYINGNGWVNFAPPLIFSTGNNLVIEDLPLGQYYLVGARIIFPFKDRLLFFGPVIQTSSTGPFYLQDAVIFSQNGTPFYTSSFTGNAVSSSTTFSPVLAPINQTASGSAYFEDVTGFGGYISAGVAQPILTVGVNQDALIVGFNSFQTRFLYTGNDIVPFNFYIVNSELGSGSTFSTINLDEGVLTRGSRGYIISSQTSVSRIDLDIPDLAFEMDLQNNGSLRVCAQRDFINEWIYFTYPSNEYEDFGNIFNNQTLLYNYRDNSWSLFNECYTSYGLMRQASGLTWNNPPAASWNTWHDSWIAGSSTVLQQQVMAGNQQGYVILRDDTSTSETASLAIQNISGGIVTSTNHGLNENDYIIINGALGTIGTLVNGIIFSVSIIDANTFTLSPTIGSGTYQGGGVITRMYIPFIQTKQFPIAWELARKTRLGMQQYLLSTTPNAQITLQIFLSQDASNAYNSGINNSLIYSSVLYTCPESTNLGLLPASTNMLSQANTNLQMLAVPSTGISASQQIWHRLNTSLIGDTVQLGFTLSDTQMRALDTNGNFISQFAEIELHGIIIDVTPSQVLA